MFYSKLYSNYKNYCVDDYNAKVYRDLFNRQVGRVFGVIAAGSFVGLAIYRPDIMVALMDRVVEQVPAVVGEFLKSLDFVNSAVTQVMATALLSYVACRTASYIACHTALFYLSYYAIKLTFLIGRVSNLISTPPKPLKGEQLLCGLEKFKAFKKDFKAKHPEAAITAETFNEIVKGFKESFGLKSIRKAFFHTMVIVYEELTPAEKRLMPLYLLFKDCSNLVKESQLFDVFILDPDIRAYLSREKVPCKGNRLILQSKYELSLYQNEFGPSISCRQPAPDVGLLARDDVCQTFYKTGLVSLDGILQNCLFELKKIQIGKKIHIYFSFMKDIDGMVKKTIAIAKKKEVDVTVKFRFYLFFLLEDKHCRLIVSVFGRNGDLVCMMSVDSDCGAPKKNFSETYCTEIENSFYKVTGSTCPYIECCLNFQNGDSNCAIYVGMICRAFLQSLGNQSEGLDEIFENYKNASGELKTKNMQVANNVRNKIVENLTEYFTPARLGRYKERRPEKEIIAFNMQRRWLLGNYMIEDIVKEVRDRLEKQEDLIFYEDSSTSGMINGVVEKYLIGHNI